MKFELLLMERSENQHRRLALEDEVMKLQGELEGEETLKSILHCALNGPMISYSCLSSFLPPQVQLLLAEVVMVEEEISMLERKVEELRLELCQERAEAREWETQQQKRLWQQNQLSRSQKFEVLRKERENGDRRASLSSTSDIRSWQSTAPNREIAQIARRLSGRRRNQRKLENASRGIVKPNELSEELLKCLTCIFLELNQTSLDKEGSAIVPKLALSCINSKGFMAKSSFNCKSPTFLFHFNSSDYDPYGILPDLDGAVRDVGPYKNFIQITNSSLDLSRFSESANLIRKLRVLVHKLCDVDLTFLTYKQKLAFWITSTIPA